MKAFFLSRLLREKILMVGLIVLAAATWLSGLLTRGQLFAREFSRTSQDLTIQSMMIGQQGRIEASAEAAIKHLEPSGTYNLLRLQAELDTIARSVGLTTTASDDSHAERTPQFTVNTVQFSIRNADYESLVRFYLELVKRSPYLGIEQFSVFTSSATNPALLSASLRVSSVEIAK